MDCTTARWIWINLRESFKKPVGCLPQNNKEINAAQIAKLSEKNSEK